MTKREFLDSLRQGLRGLPQEDIEERLLFYSEMIDDRVADGCSESEAVAKMGSVNQIVRQTLEDIPLGRLVRKRIKPICEGSGARIALLVCTSLLWLPLLVSALAVVLSLFVSLWCVTASLWSIPVALGGAGLGGVLSLLPFALQGKPFLGIAMVGAGLLSLGLSILTVPLCVLAARASVWLTKKLVFLIKSLMIFRRN